MFGMIGSAVDFARGVHAQRKMQSATDAAATAAAAALSLTESQRVQLAKDYFAQNNQGSFSGGPFVDVEVQGNNVKVSATAEVPSAFMKILGIDGIQIEAKAEAGQSGRQLEVAMMIDLTGSMNWTLGGQKKIELPQARRQ